MVSVGERVISSFGEKKSSPEELILFFGHGNEVL
jgi:hypothetical protein